VKNRALYSSDDMREDRKVKNDVKKIVQFIIQHGGKIPFTGL